MQTLEKKVNTLFKSGYSEVNGLRMYYETHGNKGDNLVLIHGGGSTIGTTFGNILPLLAKDFKIIALELQAHGHTNDRNSPESFEQDADDVAALLHTIHIPKATIFGFSNGGNTALQIAFRYPGIVHKLILASTLYRRDGLINGFFEGMQQATLNDLPQSLKTAFLKINPDPNSLLNMFTKDRDRMLHFKDWNDDLLASIKMPTLIINGDRDVVKTKHAIEMAGLIENSRIMILPATHGSYIGVAENNAPDRKVLELTVEIIKDFLNNVNLL